MHLRQIIPFSPALLTLFSCFSVAQQNPGIAVPIQAPINQTVTVSTAQEPLPFAESDRSAFVLLPREQPLVSSSVADLLREDSSLHVQARGAEGVQADISIRGTTFEQSLILVNGLRVNDPETGHLNLDIAVPLDAITRIDVLHGSGSTFYGSDAIGGAVNLITGPAPRGLGLVTSSGGGSYGSLDHHLRASIDRKHISEQITGSRETSDGFMIDRNYSSNAVAAETWLPNSHAATDILLAASDRVYGANLFYGPYDSRERTKGYFVSIGQQLGQSTFASFGFRRHSDLFVLFAHKPNYYRNNHITSSYEAALRRSDQLRPNTTLSYGVEGDGDGIRSSSLGDHHRVQGAAYANLNLRALGRFSLSAGAREEAFSGGRQVFSPNIALAAPLGNTVRLRASASHGFRLPTFVDLYYADPSTIGNPQLRPESSWSYDTGVDWTPSNCPFTFHLTGFRLQQKDSIDYAKHQLATPSLTAAERWQAINVQDLAISGAETMFHLRLSANQRLDLSYTLAHAGPPLPDIVSKYAFNYATQNAIAAWAGPLPARFHQVNARTEINVVQRTGHTAYPLWNVSASRNRGRLRPYVRLLNLSNTGYQEISGVPLQGRTLLAGAEFDFASGPAVGSSLIDP